MGVSLCEFESRPPHPDTTEEKSKGFSSFSFIQPAVNLSIISKNHCEGGENFQRSIADFRNVRTFAVQVIRVLQYPLD